MKRIPIAASPPPAARRPARSRSPVPSILAALAALASAPAAADLDALERVPLPPGATVELVAADLVQGGRAVSIATFEAGSGVDEVIGFYRERWPATDRMPGSVEVELGEWRIVSRLENGTNVALQLKTGERGRAEGLLSAQRIDAAPVADPPPVVPPGAELLSSTTSADGRDTVRTHVVRSVARPGQVVAFYRDAFERAGWALDSRGEEGAEGAVLRVSRRGARAEVVVARVPDGASVAILNEVTRGR